MLKPAIIIVDDEAIILLAMKKELQNHFKDEFSYETALNAAEGEEVIEMLCERGVDIILIISDWLMPGMKGDEFLIRVHRRHPGIRAIMVSGQLDARSVDRAKEEAGLYACVMKPWRNKELIAVVEECLGRALGIGIGDAGP
ncbi:MAG: response regulator [Spirochaetes bacterium]|nr:response regulator [Spirochaetota bacterium]MBU1078904.1 response regulator [Spirochaetota bacterium]